ncbi:uncharacterized protein IL334_001979 [Kwoniella shivajii]|uniref:t-SNARE coiled-coil homology domain-containing protein n=1 Tax=Kwoniella shivajii TaxID=564305 RepID=A0ABZ1CXL4_9TREE|nr:hypothetical protein IL334_001979 [Kwoniella shivajii]
MSRDPYIDVKREVESTLSTLPSLLSSYSPSSSSSSSSGVHEELRNTLQILEDDLEDLEESVRVVEGMGDKWGISQIEVSQRRRFVESVKREVNGLRAKISSGNNKNRRDEEKGKGKGKGKGKSKAGIGKNGRYRDNPYHEIDLERGDQDDDRDDDEEDLEEAKRWEAEQQQLFVQRQDDTLGVISGTLHTLASQAGLIGNEVSEQSEMLDDLGNRVDNTDTKLRKVSKTMQDFIRRNEETKSGWCIGILIVILVILLLLVIIT